LRDQVYQLLCKIDLNAYYDVVKQTYDEAVTAFNGVKLQSVEYDIEFACMSAKQMLHKSSNRDNLNEHIILCKELSKKYFDIARKFPLDLENVISEMQTSSQAQVNISHLPFSRKSSSTVLSGTDNRHAVQNRLGRGGVRDVAGVSFGGALQPEQTLTDDNLNKYPVSKNEEVDYSYLANNSVSKLQSPRYAIPSRDLTRKRFSIVSAYAGYEPPPINISLSKSRHGSNKPVNREHACNSQCRRRPIPTFSGIRREWPKFRTV